MKEDAVSAVVICGMCVVSFITVAGMGAGAFTADSTGSFATCTCGIGTWATGACATGTGTFGTLPTDTGIIGTLPTGSLISGVFSWAVIAERKEEERVGLYWSNGCIEVAGTALVAASGLV